MRTQITLLAALFALLALFGCISAAAEQQIAPDGTSQIRLTYALLGNEIPAKVTVHRSDYCVFAAQAAAREGVTLVSCEVSGTRAVVNLSVSPEKSGVETEHGLLSDTYRAPAAFLSQTLVAFSPVQKKEGKTDIKDVRQLRQAGATAVGAVYFPAGTHPQDGVQNAVRVDLLETFGNEPVLVANNTGTRTRTLLLALGFAAALMAAMILAAWYRWRTKKHRVSVRKGAQSDEDQIVFLQEGED